MPVTKLPKNTLVEAIRGTAQRMQQPTDDNVLKAQLLGFLGKILENQLPTEAEQIMPMPAAMAVQRLPLQKLADTAETFGSVVKQHPLTKHLYNPEEYGTYVDPDTGLSTYVNVFRNMQNQTPQFLHELSQEMLKKLGVRSDDTVELFRRGALDAMTPADMQKRFPRRHPFEESTFIPPNQFLRSTSVSPDAMRLQQGSPWNPLMETQRLEVPAKDIGYFAALLRRGDPLTAGEVLVPESVLQQMLKK